MDASAAPHGTHKREPDTSELARLQEVYDRLVALHPTSLGKSTSKEERERRQMAESTLVYGEIKFEPFATALLKIRDLYGGLRGEGQMFYDIGSGTGKAVFAAALVHPFERCVGIEILDGLHRVSKELHTRWEDEIKPGLPAENQLTEIDFLHGDAFDIPWEDATVVFANSTCFSEEMMELMASCANDLASGAFVVTFTRRLPSPAFEVLELEEYKMTWGTATVFIHRKK